MYYIQNTTHAISLTYSTFHTQFPHHRISQKIVDLMSIWRYFCVLFILLKVSHDQFLSHIWEYCTSKVVRLAMIGTRESQNLCNLRVVV